MSSEEASPPFNRNTPPPAGAPHGQRKGILASVERFLAVETASGLLLIIAAAAALFFANSAWRTAYLNLWLTPIGFRLGNFVLEHNARFWINDGLMTIFFFVAGLEIRREVQQGELSNARSAALPIAAALGGMVCPALIYLAVNRHGPAAAGWAIPMATDIAFAVGVLALLGKGVPSGLRVLLLSLAVIDDVGAILVIATFYSEGISGTGVGIIALGIVIIVLMRVTGARPALAYAIPGTIVWAGAHIAGIHPALSGVILAWVIPATLIPIEQTLHAWVAFLIMPLFAFANAGVPVNQITFAGDAGRVFWGVAIGLAIGKAAGIFGASRFAASMGLTALPPGLRWSYLSVVAFAGGIGFTMALFTAQLAFQPGPLLEMAKAGILGGSAAAGVMSLCSGRAVLPPHHGNRP